MWKLILLDLDGTLLRSDKTISPRTLAVLARCREKGCAIAVCTARGASNAAQYVARVQPDFVTVGNGQLRRFYRLRKSAVSIFLPCKLF